MVRIAPIEQRQRRDIERRQRGLLRAQQEARECARQVRRSDRGCVQERDHRGHERHDAGADEQLREQRAALGGLDENARAAGASPAELAQQSAELKKFQEQYNNIFFNVGMTLLEPLPVGIVMTLISALILKRNRKDLQDGQDEVKGTPVARVNPV